MGIFNAIFDERIITMKYFSLLLLPFLAACQFSARGLASGHYEGSLILDRGGRLSEFPVVAEIPKLEKSISVSVSNLDGSARPSIELSDIRGDSLRLRILELGADSILLVKNQDCYVNQDNDRVHLCPKNDQLSIEVLTRSGDAVFSLNLNYFPGGHQIALEPPQNFSLAGAVKNALTLDFGSRIEFQRVMQARHLAANAYLNLLPHLGTNSILAAATASNFVGLLSAVGDLAPFLLPSRWLQAKEQALASQAERDALILMRGDAGVQVEGLAYAIARDEKIQAEYQIALDQARTIRSQLNSSENDIMDSLLISMEADSAELDLSIREQKSFFAQAMGLNNPAAVLDLSVPEAALPIEVATDLDASTMSGAALGRSFELRQMDYLIHAARIAKKATYFGWLDPSGDPSGELGFGFGEKVALAASKVAELVSAREEIQSIVLQKLANTVAEYNDSMEDHERSGRNFAIQERRLQRILSALPTGAALDRFDVVTTLQAHLGAKIGLLNSEAVYRISHAKLDRLMLEGFYSTLSGGEL